MSEPDKRVSARHKKACTECRQQKAKCDAYINPDAPCSRCRKVGATCVISDPFKREHKRKRLSQLEREAEDLRKRLHVNHHDKITSSGLNAPTELSRTPRSLGSTPTTSPPQSVDPSTLLSAQQFPFSINARPPPVVLPATSSVANDPTQARTLKGTRVDAQEIDDIFRLFFQDYAPFMPILDPNTSPNGYYEQSLLLFWTIIFVGSRSYTRNPTLFPTLSDSVLETLLLSMKNNSTPVFKIQSFLLFLTWPLPVLEVAFPLCGWLLNLAMQNGLHLPMASHEFGGRNVASTEGPRNNKMILSMDMQRRSELWAYCIVVYQRACLQKGQPPRAMLGLVPESGHKLCHQVSPALALQLSCLDIVSKCSTAIFALGVRNTSAEHERSMTILIRAHETQLNDLVSQLPPNHNTLFPTIARLQIQVFYLYKDLTGPYDHCFYRLASTACSLIEHMKILFGKPQTYTSSPYFAMNALVLAGACLLRLLKSSMAPNVDVERAKNYLFACITTLQHINLDPNDLAAKCALSMNQLWNSTKAYRKADGTEYSTLRIRSRLVMSPVIDMALWWREEFDMEDMQRKAEAESTQPETSHSTDAATGEFAIPGQSDVDELQFLNDEFLNDFQWAALSSDFMLPIDSYEDMGWPAMSSTNTNGGQDLPLV